MNEGDANGDTALIHTCRAGDMDMTSLLLNNGADLTKQNSCGVTALQAAVCAGHTDMVVTLLDNPLSRADAQDINGENASLVSPSCAYTCVKFLDIISSPATNHDNNRPPLVGRTALHWACAMGNVPCIRGLVQVAVGSVLLETQNGDTCLHVAISNKRCAFIHRGKNFYSTLV